MSTVWGDSTGAGRGWTEPCGRMSEDRDSTLDTRRKQNHSGAWPDVCTAPCGDPQAARTASVRYERNRSRGVAVLVRLVPLAGQTTVCCLATRRSSGPASIAPFL